jgi:hypothetical protein
MPTYALWHAATEFKHFDYDKILTTGIPLSTHFQMHSKGKLVFNLIPYKDGIEQREQNTLEIKAWGKKLEGEFAHFNIYADTLKIGDAYTSRKEKNYVFRFDESIPDSIVIEYDNDGFNSFKDRNLSVEYLSINDYPIRAKSKNVLYRFRAQGTTYTKNTDFDNYAEEAKEILKSFGIPDSMIIPLPTPEVERFKTYSSTVIVNNWLNKTDPHAKTVTLFTQSVHARRSYMCYKKTVGKNRKIGVFATRHRSFDWYNWYIRKMGLYHVFKESAGIVYMKLFLDEKEQKKQIDAAINIMN